MKKPVSRVLQHTQFEEIIGTRHIFFELDEAESWWTQDLGNESIRDIDDIDATNNKSNKNLSN